MRSSRRGAVGRALLAVGVALVFLVPLVWIAAASLRAPDQPPPRAIEWLPSPVSFAAWDRLGALIPVGRNLGSSLLIAAIGVPLATLVASMAGFAMSQLAAPARRVFVVATVVLLLVPATALWLPRFLLYRSVGLLDTPVALVAPAILGGSPLLILLCFWACRRIPAELVEAARLEGAGAIAAWRRVALPLIRPTLAVVGLLAFLLFWGDVASPTLYLRTDAWATLPLGLRRLEQLDRSDWPVLMAGAVLLALPAVLLFLVVQHRALRDDRLADTIG
ncbi:MAG: carbohydrate ABC transporter permease [Chloroflexota bacterium]